MLNLVRSIRDFPCCCPILGIYLQNTAREGAIFPSRSGFLFYCTKNKAGDSMKPVPWYFTNTQHGPCRKEPDRGYLAQQYKETRTFTSSCHATTRKVRSTQAPHRPKPRSLGQWTRPKCIMRTIRRAKFKMAAREASPARFEVCFCYYFCFTLSITKFCV